MSLIRAMVRNAGLQWPGETPEERTAGESLAAAVRAAAAPGPWQPPGAGAAPVPVAAAAPPMAAAPPAPAPSPAHVPASGPAPLAPRAMPAHSLSQPSAAAMWADVAADLNGRSGFNADGTPQTHGGRLLFVEPRGKRSADPLWDATAEELNAGMRAGATPEASSATGGQRADLWDGVAARLNTEGRAGNAGFAVPGARGARNLQPRIS